MPATGKSREPDLEPEQRRDEIISILVAGLVRLIGGGAVTRATATALPDISNEQAAGMPTEGPGGIVADPTSSMAAEKTLEIQQDWP